MFENLLFSIKSRNACQYEKKCSWIEKSQIQKMFAKSKKVCKYEKGYFIKYSWIQNIANWKIVQECNFFFANMKVHDFKKCLGIQKKFCEDEKCLLIQKWRESEKAKEKVN